MGGDALQLGR